MDKVDEAFRAAGPITKPKCNTNMSNAHEQTRRLPSQGIGDEPVRKASLTSAPGKEHALPGVSRATKRHRRGARIPASTTPERRPATRCDRYSPSVGRRTVLSVLPFLAAQRRF